MKIIWYMVLKYKVQQTETFLILGNFLAFQPPENPENQNLKIEKSTWRYYYFTHLHHKWQSYDVWFLWYGVQQTEFFVILDWFLSFPPYGPRKSKFLKCEKKHLKILPEDIIILQMCVINDSHMMHCSWDMECNGQNFLSFGTVCWPFTPLPL